MESGLILQNNLLMLVSIVFGARFETTSTGFPKSALLMTKAA